MHIAFNTEDLSELDYQILGVITGQPEDAPKATAAASPAKKAAAAAKPETKDEPDEDTSDDSTDGPTIDDAKAKASALVSNGEAAKVKAALTAVGAKKVSEIDADKVAEFLAELG